jgi:hypothetical protein
MGWRDRARPATAVVEPEWRKRSREAQQEAYDAEQPTTREQIAAGAVGMANALSFGLADEARGLVDVIAPKREDADVPLAERYARARDGQRAANEEVLEAAPGSYGIGEGLSIIPQMAFPVAKLAPTVRGFALAGAGQGALGGFGAGEGLGGSLEGAGIGAVIGGALGAGGGKLAANRAARAAAKSDAPASAPAAPSTSRVKAAVGALGDAAEWAATKADESPLTSGALSVLTKGGSTAALALARKVASATKGLRTKAPPAAPDEGPKPSADYLAMLDEQMNEGPLLADLPVVDAAPARAPLKFLEPLTDELPPASIVIDEPTVVAAPRANGSLVDVPLLDDGPRSIAQELATAKWLAAGSPKRAPKPSRQARAASPFEKPVPGAKPRRARAPAPADDARAQALEQLAAPEAPAGRDLAVVLKELNANPANPELMREMAAGLRAKGTKVDIDRARRLEKDAAKLEAKAPKAAKAPEGDPDPSPAVDARAAALDEMAQGAPAQMGGGLPLKNPNAWPGDPDFGVRLTPEEWAAVSNLDEMPAHWPEAPKKAPKAVEPETPAVIEAPPAPARPKKKAPDHERTDEATLKLSSKLDRARDPGHRAMKDAVDKAEEELMVAGVLDAEANSVAAAWREFAAQARARGEDEVAAMFNAGMSRGEKPPAWKPPTTFAPETQGLLERRTPGRQPLVDDGGNPYEEKHALTDYMREHGLEPGRPAPAPDARAQALDELAGEPAKRETIEPTGGLQMRIAQALGWSIDDVHSVGLPGLRDLVRAKDPGLAAEISATLTKGTHIRGRSNRKTRR